MKKPSDRSAVEAEELRKRILGMGATSMRKSYYPVLRARMAELERYRALTDQAQDGICLLTLPALRIFDANRAARRFLELPEGELEDQIGLGQLLEDDSSTALAHWAGDRSAPAPRLELERDGRVLELVLTEVVFSERPHAVAVLRDISERRKVEAMLRQAQKMDSIGQLAGGVAHDFNNMLGGILGFAELLLLDADGDSKQKMFLDGIIDAARRAADLTGKLLSFSRKGPVVTKPLDLHGTIDHALALLERSIDRRIEISTSYLAELSRVRGDAAQLSSLFLNLGLNARDAMPDGGQLHVSTAVVELDAGEFVEAVLTDTGTGIPHTALSRIFDPFYTTKDVGKGTGLGLASAYATVADHGGEITVTSESGVGTSFTIRLPLFMGDDDAASRGEEVVIPECDVGVLVVDDEEMIRTVAVEILRSLGCEVRCASDGEEALEIYRLASAAVDVVVLDMVMPKMNGADCFAALREIDPAVPVVIASGYAQTEQVSRLLRQGAVLFVKKPFRRVELARAVAAALETRKQPVA